MSIRFHNDPSAYVAHYTRAEIALDLILKSGRIRLSPFIATNDPRETKTWVFAVGHNPSGRTSSSEVEALAKRNIDFNHILKQGCKILCVSEDAANAWKLNVSDRCYGKARMWAQYADNHTGICLVFDKEALDRTLKTTMQPLGTVVAGRVKYFDSFNDVGTQDWLDHMEAFLLSADDVAERGLEDVLYDVRNKYIQTFFFTKNKDWETEMEYRWIVLSKNDGPEFIQIDDSLRAILLGIDFPQKRLKEVHDYCRRYKAHLSRIVWINGMPGVHWIAPDDISAEATQPLLIQLGLNPS